MAVRAAAEHATPSREGRCARPCVLADPDRDPGTRLRISLAAKRCAGFQRVGRTRAGAIHLAAEVTDGAPAPGACLDAGISAFVVVFRTAARRALPLGTFAPARIFGRTARFAVAWHEEPRSAVGFDHGSRHRARRVWKFLEVEARTAALEQGVPAILGVRLWCRLSTPARAVWGRASAGPRRPFHRPPRALTATDQRNQHS